MEVFAPFIAIFALAVLEYLAARAWLPAYFRFGIPLIRLRLLGIRVDQTAESRLDGVTTRNSSHVVYRRLSEGEIAFREKGQSNVAFRYVPVVHGLIRYAPEEGATYIIGWLNYWTLAAIGFMAYLWIDASRYRKPWELLFWFAFIFGAMVLIGVLRYRGVARALRAETTPAPATPPPSPAR